MRLSPLKSIADPLSPYFLAAVDTRTINNLSHFNRREPNNIVIHHIKKEQKVLVAGRGIFMLENEDLKGQIGKKFEEW
jgi:hypothetical protein